jgi:D-glycero-D-manno-heptose 1,7-bisphosphate phosphatase
MQRAVFLDRDGVINATVWNEVEQIFDSPYALGDFALLPGSGPAIRRINDAGLLAVVISNQPGPAKGKCGIGLIEELTAKMRLLLDEDGARVDGVYYCLHHPQAAIAEFRLECDCRKPRPGLLRLAANDLDIDLGRSFMVGDQQRDVEAAIAAGCTPVLVGARGVIDAPLIADGLEEAVDALLCHA